MPDELRVAVVGLGKIGLPLAAQFAGKGASVIGCDVDEGVVGAVNDGACPISGEPGLEEALANARAAGRLRATTDTSSAAHDSEVVIVIVPVGIDAEGRTDYRYLDAAAAAVGRGLQKDSLVILESTVPVGATRNRLGSRLSEASGLGTGDFRLAYSPERVSSGSIFRDLATYPKLVGGADAASAAQAAAFYRRMLDAEVMLLPDAETAEFTKLAESVYRDVNIALANELARAAEKLGIDYQVAGRAANSQPYSHLHSPGVGVGGHCIPVYPYFLLETSPDQRLLTASREINDSMAGHAVHRLDEAFREEGGLAGKTVLILGLSYRGGVKEATLSSTHLLTRSLQQRGASVLVHDPLFSTDEIARQGLRPASLPPATPVDAVVLQAMHPEYADLDPVSLAGCRVFLDGRAAFDRTRVEAAGVRYLAIGLGR
jgi:nucleotide sugar dehydrogenase